MPICDKFGRQVAPKPPYMPWVAPYGETPPSFTVKRDWDTIEYPPLFSEDAHMKGVLFKDTFVFYRPSEVIGKFVRNHLLGL